MSAHALIPVTLLLGTLGAGKTTLLKTLLAEKPVHAYWAIIVNDFGAIGLDGASLAAATSADHYQVIEIPGGCVCCVQGPVFSITLARLLRARRPDRLLIEPSGLAHPRVIVDQLRAPHFAKHLRLGAVLGVIDPAQTRTPHAEIAAEQWSLMNVVMASKCDIASAAELAAIQRAAAQAVPPKLAVCTLIHGHAVGGSLPSLAQWDAVLWADQPDIEARPRDLSYAPIERTPLRFQSNTKPLPISGLPQQDVVQTHHQARADGRSLSWCWPAHFYFERTQLEQAFGQMVRDISVAMWRAKGVFQLQDSALQVDWTPQHGWHWQASAWRSDSRFTVLAAPSEDELALNIHTLHALLRDSSTG